LIPPSVGYNKTTTYKFLFFFLSICTSRIAIHTTDIKEIMKKINIEQNRAKSPPSNIALTANEMISTNPKYRITKLKVFSNSLFFKLVFARK